MNELILTNARVVTRSEVFDGTVIVRDGAIAAVDAGRSALSGALDLDGDLLIPGLIEMHTDNMEKHFEPRPGVLWPNGVAAVCAHDTQIIGAAITTVYDAVAVGETDAKGQRRHILADCVSALKHAQDNGMLRADHLLHMRCEVADPCVVEMFEPFAADPLVRLVSLMDHTPGQRQWSDVSKFVQYHNGENWGQDKLDSILQARLEDQARYATRHRREIVALSRDRGLALASHDDATEAHIQESLDDGCVIAEFPITVTAATMARQHGLGTIMGGPNVVRGGSHSGNVSAIELARLGLLTGLSSDYVPYSLLQAVFRLEAEADMTLPQAVACVTANIADMVGLSDRGEITPGKRADLARVRPVDGAPLVRDVWRQGRRVY
ncbi:MAG: alpha-D-ribose 1-methylphosphonate 5-triphosphate diphosphatase [Rhodospirillaceae bacterium]